MFPVLSKKDQEILHGDFCFRGFGVWVSGPTSSYGDAVEGVWQVRRELSFRTVSVRIGLRHFSLALPL